MEDIAKSAQLSRQAIYKKFGSKEGVMEWMLRTYIEEIHAKTIEAINVSGAKNPRQAILRAFECWSGELVPIISNTAHGAEVLNMGMQFAAESGINWEEEVLQQISQYIYKSGLSKSKGLAIEQAEVLNYASKGIMMKTNSSQEFSQEMARVIRVIFSST